MRCKTEPTGFVRAGVGLAAGFAAWSVVGGAHADPIRLRADAVADTQTETQSPTGLLVLQGQDKIRPWIDVEGLVWTGTKPGLTGDVLVLAVHVRAPHNFGEVRVGRFVLATGAIFPVQLDGAAIIGRTRWGGKLELFGGAPVVPRFGARAYDWLTGGRIAETFGSTATLGVSYVQRREYGTISNEEVGADFSAAPVRWLDVAAKAAYDVTSPGIADARVSAATRVSTLRLELFASRAVAGEAAAGDVAVLGSR